MNRERDMAGMFLPCRYRAFPGSLWKESKQRNFNCMTRERVKNIPKQFLKYQKGTVV